MSTFCFSVQAERSPASLPRVFDTLSIGGVVPQACHCTVTPDEICIDVQIAELDKSAAFKLAQRLRRLIVVSTVLYAEKTVRAAA